jgi:hypothetical protein
MEMVHQAAVALHHAKVVAHRSQDPNLVLVGAEELLEEGINNEVKVFCNEGRVPNGI